MGCEASNCVLVGAVRPVSPSALLGRGNNGLGCGTVQFFRALPIVACREFGVRLRQELKRLLSIFRYAYFCLSRQCSSPSWFMPVQFVIVDEVNHALDISVYSGAIGNNVIFFHITMVKVDVKSLGAVESGYQEWVAVFIR